MWRRKLVVTVVGVLLLLAGGLVVGFGPLVRRRLAARAARYGATVQVEQVQPLWLGVVLHGVDVQLEDVPSSSIHLDSVRVELEGSGAAKLVVIEGGKVQAQGSAEELKQQVGKLRERLHQGGTGGGGSGTPVQVRGITAAWIHGDEKVSVGGGTLERSDSGWRAQADTIEASRPRQSVHGQKLEMELVKSEQGLKLGRWKAEQLEADVTLASEPAEAGKGHEADETEMAPGAVASAAAPTKGAPTKEKGGGKKRRRGAPKGEESVTPGATVAPTSGRAVRLLAQATAAKTKVHQVAQLALLGIADGASVAVDRLEVTVHREQQKLHVGPGALSVKTLPGMLSISLTPVQAAVGGSPLLLSAEIPAEASGEVSLRVSGGPVTLAMLGVQEHDLGLLDVAKTSVEAGGVVKLLGGGERVELDVQGQIRGLSVSHPKLSTEPVRGLDLRFAWAGGGALDGSSVRVDRGELDVGKVHGEVSGTFEQQADGHHIRGKFAVPLASCQSLGEALPTGLAPKMAGVKMAGTFAVNGRVDFDSRKGDESLVEFSLLNDCRLLQPGPEINVARFRQPFRRMVYSPENKLVEIESGPGTPGWTSFAGITPFMEAAVLTTEDGGFRRHRGFDQEAIRNSIRENLKAGRFVRGASTISMQTAKNLYLTRDKTVGRKLQEALLTMYLEQELSKEQILELYLNSIEFGPMIYGIGPAAQHYFHTTPAELSLGQALYLASILPNPKRQHFGADGKVSPGHMAFLHRLMRMMVKRNLLREDEMQEGLTEWVVFGQPKPPKEAGDSLEDLEKTLAPR